MLMLHAAACRQVWRAFSEWLLECSARASTGFPGRVGIPLDACLLSVNTEDSWGRENR